ncbi:vesicle-associated membrane protein 7-like isoform X1 [Hydra vulgaris]|uniref:Vesicle-associated membrane protein 7 n=1 Tax=Hydra vulgaris TaxID=6087 RepID=A0ABM4D3T3_HYDVU
MSILYCTITRGTAVLVKHAKYAGNFQEVVEHILVKIETNKDSKMSYTQTGYLFHYIVESGIIYLCITDEAFDRSTSFMFLLEVKKRFTKTYQHRIETALPFAMQSEFSNVLASEMNRFSNSIKNDPTQLKNVENQINELKGIMISNIDTITRRGEKLELLVEKADGLNASSLTFKKSSKSLSRALFMKNVKIGIAIFLTILVIILIIVFASCGTNWSNCGK